jgi:nicotinamidase-related amidase
MKAILTKNFTKSTYSVIFLSYNLSWLSVILLSIDILYVGIYNTNNSYLKLLLQEEVSFMRVNNRYVSFYYENDNDMGAIEIDPKKTALLVVDMQHVFITRPALENPTPEELAEAERWEPFFSKIDSVVVPNNQRLLQAFRERNMNVCFAKIQCQKKDGSDRSLDQKATGYNELLLPPGTPSAEIVPELKPMEDEIVVTKTTDSVLAGTSLRLWLNNMGIDTVVVTGVLTDQCVSGTVRSLADESFKVWLIEDACMASTQRIQDNELEILNNIYCHVINTDELIEALS